VPGSIGDRFVIAVGLSVPAGPAAGTGDPARCAGRAAAAYEETNQPAAERRRVLDTVGGARRPRRR
jgi:hypothetical protein